MHAYEPSSGPPSGPKLAELCHGWSCRQVRDDLRVAISVALLLFSSLLSVVTTGTIVMPPHLATALRVRRRRWAPASLGTAATMLVRGYGTSRDFYEWDRAGRPETWTYRRSSQPGRADLVGIVVSSALLAAFFVKIMLG